MGSKFPRQFLVRRFAVGAQCIGTTHLPPESARRPRHITESLAIDAALAAARPRTRAVQNRGANVQSSEGQRATISGTSCRRR